MKRKYYDRLLEWKRRAEGRTALLLDGARRVGKSYLAEEFGKNEYDSYILIDFSRPRPGCIRCFEENSNDFDTFFATLSAIYDTKLIEKNSLIIFDEVQLYPPARQLIKHLVADGRYDYIETGSLISLRKNVKDILIPSEEEYMEIFPMDFEEFLWAIGNETTVPFLQKHFDERLPLGQELHRKILNDFRKYMIVGGMPQSVKAFAETGSFEEADWFKKQILSLYREDIGKYAGKDTERVYSIFDNIPNRLAKKEKKYKLSDIDEKARSRSYDDAFIWLDKAMIINRCFNSTDPNIGLMLSEEHSTQKCYLCDTGLLVTQAFRDNEFADNELYKAILLDKLNVNEGMIMENIVAQMLRAKGHKLYFYSRVNKSKRANHMEIDFLISDHKKIMPVEVKSSSYRKHSSLDKFSSKFSSKLGERFILYTKDVMIKDGVIHLPIYMGMFL